MGAGSARTLGGSPTAASGPSRQRYSVIAHDVPLNLPGLLLDLPLRLVLCSINGLFGIAGHFRQLLFADALGFFCGTFDLVSYSGFHVFFWVETVTDQARCGAFPQGGRLGFHLRAERRVTSVA